MNTPKLNTKRLPFKGLTPRATPVDTYVRPAEQAVAPADYCSAQSLAGVAQALSQVNPKINAYFKQQMEKQNSQAEAKGYQEALENNRKSWNDFLDQTKQKDSGLYEQYAGSNPHLKKGWDRAWLEGQVMDYSDTLDGFLMNPEVTLEDGSTANLFEMDQGMVSDYFQNHLSDFMDERGINQMDPVDIEEHFSRRALGLQSNLRQQEMRERRAAMVNKRVDQLGSTTLQRITQAMKTPSWEENPHASRQALGNIIREEIAKAHEDGVRDFTKLNQRVGMSIIALAKDARDESILDVLDWVETKEGGGLSADGTPKNSIGNALSGEITQARISIMRLKNDEIRAARANEAYLKQEYLDTVTGELYEKLSEFKRDPNLNVGTVDIEPYAEKLRQRGLYHEAEKLEQMKVRMMSAEDNVQTDYAILTEMQDKISSGRASDAEIIAGMGVFYNESTGNRLLNENKFWKTREMREVADVVQDTERSIRSQVTGSDSMVPGMDGALKRRGFEAVQNYRIEFRKAVREYQSKHGEFPDDLELHSINNRVASAIVNDPLYRTEMSTPDRVLDVEQQNKVKNVVGDNPPQGSTDFFRLPRETVKQELDMATFLGPTFTDFEQAVEQFEQDESGPLGLLMYHLYGRSWTDEQATEVIQRQYTVYSRFVRK